MGTILQYTMRIISKKTLKDFYEQSKYSDSKSSLEAWYNEVLKLDWENPNEVKEMYRNASIIGKEKVVFNIAGNKYRLIVKINYYAKIIFIKFIGTHNSMIKSIWRIYNMNIKPIKNEQNYSETLQRIEKLMSAKPNTPQMDELEVLTTLVEAYEEQHYKIDAPDPIEAIKFRMEQEGLKQKDSSFYCWK